MLDSDIAKSMPAICQSLNCISCLALLTDWVGFSKLTARQSIALTWYPTRVYNHLLSAQADSSLHTTLCSSTRSHYPGFAASSSCQPNLSLVPWLSYWTFPVIHPWSWPHCVLDSRVSSGCWQLLPIEWSSQDICCDLLSVSFGWPTAHVFWPMFRLDSVIVFLCLPAEARDWSWYCWWQGGCCGVLLLLSLSTQAIFLFGMIRTTISCSMFAFTGTSS